MSAIFIVILILVGVLFIQSNHYCFLERQGEQKTLSQLSESLDLKLDSMDEELHDRFKEFDDYKKKVDALTLRAGFKL